MWSNVGVESLALLAAIILLSTIVAGAACAVVLVRRPRRLTTRLLAGTVGVVALAAGLNIARLEIAVGTRVMGGVTAALGVGALVVSIRGRRDVVRAEATSSE